MDFVQIYNNYASTYTKMRPHLHTLFLVQAQKWSRPDLVVEIIFHKIQNATNKCCGIQKHKEGHKMKLG